jgi:CrcB protein
MPSVEGWYQVALLSVGGSLGVNARYWLGVAINRWVGPRFPWATLAINVSGSFAIGLLTVFLSRPPSPHLRLLLVVGFLGGYTTFSSFSAETLVLWERGERAHCVGYVVGSVGAGLVAVVLGTALGRGLFEAADRWSGTGEQSVAVGAAGTAPTKEEPGGRGDSPRSTPGQGGGSEATP